MFSSEISLGMKFQRLSKQAPDQTGKNHIRRGISLYLTVNMCIYDTAPLLCEPIFSARRTKQEHFKTGRRI